MDSLEICAKEDKTPCYLLSTNDENRNDYNMDLAPALIEKVGDPLLKRTLYKMLDEFYVRNPQVKGMMRRWSARKSALRS